MTVKAAIEKARATNRSTPSDLSFDGDSYTSDYRIQLFYKQYSFETARGNGFASSTTASGSVTLPLPTNLQDAYGININSNELGALGKIIAKGADAGAFDEEFSRLSSQFSSQFKEKKMTVGGVLGESLGAAFTAGENLIKSLDTKDFSNAASYLVRRGFSKIGVAESAFSAGVGTALNNHAALVFEGVGLKNYSMSWQLAPRSEREAETIRSIINTIKQKMHPTVVEGAGEGFLQYPHLFQPLLQGVNPDHTFTFNPGFIKDLQVDYSPNGMAFNRGGIPSSVNFTITFEEAKTRSSDDFSNGGSE